MRKGVNFRIALAPIFVAGCIPLHSQVKPGQSITSPFTTYEDADLIDPGAFSIGQYASFVRTGGGNSVSATGVDFSFGWHRRIELSGFGAATFSRVGGNQLAAEPDNSYVGLRAISNLGWNRTEVRGSAGLSINVSPRWSIFLEAGRTLGRMDQNSSHLDVSASISFTGRMWGRKPSSEENAPAPQALLPRRSACTPTLCSTPYSWPALR